MIYIDFIVNVLLCTILLIVLYPALTLSALS